MLFCNEPTKIRKSTYFSFKGDPVEIASVTKDIKLAVQNLEVLFVK